MPLLLGGSLFFVWWFFLADMQTDTTEAHYSRTEFEEDAGTIYYDIGRLALARKDYLAAAKAFNAAISIYPTMLSCYDALGKTYEKMGNLNKAFETYAKAMSINQHFNLIRNNATITSHQAEKYKDLEAHGIKKWHGELLQGKNIYVFFGDNVGNAFLFLRFLNNLCAIAKNVYVQAPREFVALLQKSSTNTAHINHVHDLTEISCSYYTTLSALPHYLGLTYQRVDRQPKQYIKLPPLALTPDSIQSLDRTKYNIGIVWRTQDSLKKEIPLDLFTFLTKLPNIQLYAIQDNLTNQEISQCQADGIKIPTFLNAEDYLEKAYFVENLDLIIGLESPMIHISCAMGKKTILIPHHPAAWYWFTINEYLYAEQNNTNYTSAFWYDHMIKLPSYTKETTNKLKQQLNNCVLNFSKNKS